MLCSCFGPRVADVYPKLFLSFRDFLESVNPSGHLKVRKNKYMFESSEDKHSKVLCVRPGGTLSSLLLHPMDPNSGVEAHLPHNHLHPLKATPIHPEPHLPGNVELQQGALLHEDVNILHGHPGVNCDELPPHTHPLPPCDTKKRKKNWKGGNLGRLREHLKMIRWYP